jgi:hypothetical protein
MAKGASDEHPPPEMVAHDILELSLDDVEFLGERVDRRRIEDTFEDQEALLVVLPGLVLVDQAKRPLAILPLEVVVEPVLDHSALPA